MSLWSKIATIAWSACLIAGLTAPAPALAEDQPASPQPPSQTIPVAPLSPEAANLARQGIALSKAGRASESEAILRRSLDIVRANKELDNPQCNYIFAYLAWDLIALGKFSEAQDLARQAVSGFKKWPDAPPQDVIDASNIWASSLVSLMKRRQAHDVYFDTLIYAERKFGFNDPRIVIPMASVATLTALSPATESDLLPTSELQLRRALEIAQDPANAGYNSAYHLTESLSAYLAGVLLKEKKYAEAVTLSRQAAAQIESRPTLIDMNVVSTYLLLSQALEGLNHHEEAEAVARKAVATSDAVKDGGWSKGQALRNLAQILVAENLNDEALGALKQSAGILKVPSTNGYIDTMWGLASVLNLTGKASEALKIARDIASTPGPTAVYLDALYKAGKAGEISRDTGVRESFDIVQRLLDDRPLSNSAQTLLSIADQRSRAETLSLTNEIKASQDLLFKLRKIRDELDAQVFSEHGDLDAIDRLRKEDDEIGRRFDRQEASFQALSAGYKEARAQAATTLEVVQKTLGENEALILIDPGEEDKFTGRKHGYEWAITKEGADWSSLNLDEPQIASYVRRLRNSIAGGRDRSATPVLADTSENDDAVDFDVAAAAELYAGILRPLEHVFASKKKLIFIVSGALASLPPAVLVVNKPPVDASYAQVDWLVKHYAIEVIPSVESLAWQRDLHLPHAPLAMRGYANPLFGGASVKIAQNRGVGDFYRGSEANLDALRAYLPQLPETEGELRQIASRFGAADSDVIVGAAATETDVKKAALDQYRVLYFATHGLIAGELDHSNVMAEPALVLSLPAKATDEDDGLLTASEILHLRLNADLVVLSACDTASGAKLGAEPLSGLASAFFFAGARSLLVSHWPVDSNATVALMTSLFKSSAIASSADMASELQAAMLALMSDERHPEWSSPRYWAPFVLVGG